MGIITLHFSRLFNGLVGLVLVVLIFIDGTLKKKPDTTELPYGKQALSGNSID